MIRALLLSASLLNPAHGIKAGFTLLPGNNAPAVQTTTAPADTALAPIASPVAVPIAEPIPVKPLSPTPQSVAMTTPANNVLGGASKLYTPTPEFTPVLAPTAPAKALPMLQEKTVKTSINSTSTIRPLGETSVNGTVVGFGKHVPLVIALNELAPDGSQQAFGKNVNPQMPIDWQGGQDWLSTLNQSLAANGLKATYTNNTVFIESMQAHVMNAAMDGGSSGTVALAPISQPPVSNYNKTTTTTITPLQPNSALPPLLQPTVVPNMVAPSIAQNTVTDTSSTIYKQDADRNIPNQDNNSVILSQSNSSNGLPMLDPIAKLPPPAAPGGYMAPPRVDNTPMVTTTTQTVATTSQVMPVPSAPMAQPVNLQAGNMATMSTADMNQQWSARKGTTLRHVLEEWASRAGVELVWNTEYDFPVQASVNINGGFDEAVRTLLRGFNQATPQPVAIMHKATAENTAVLVVTARGNDYGSDN